MYSSICARVQAITGRDVGGRGMGALVMPGELERAGCLFAAAPSTIVLTGFPCRLDFSPPTETDGPSGAAALALGAHRLGAPSAIAVDDSSASVLSACASAAGLSGSSVPPFALLSFPPRGASSWAPSHTAALARALRGYTHAVAVERAGVAGDGTYRTMRGRVMDAFVAPLDVLLTGGTEAGRGAAAHPSTAPTAHAAAAALVPGLREEEEASPFPFRTSTGIGDGGNECGMGRVVTAVRASIAGGDVIACVTPADALVAAGVSNWGAWAVLAAAEAAVRCYAAGGAEGLPPSCPPPSPASLLALASLPVGALLPSPALEGDLSRAMAGAGAGDGITGATDGAVDGMPLTTHLQVLEAVRGVLLEAFKEGGATCVDTARVLSEDA